MAATATEQILHDGGRNLILKYTIAGASGDTTAGTLVTASSFTDKNGDAVGANGFTLVSVKSSLTGFSCNLLWDATANINLVELPADSDITRDYSCCGGIKDNSGAGSTGNILFTTTGYGAGGDGGVIILKLRKN